MTQKMFHILIYTKNYVFYVSMWFSFILLSSCAQVITPSGGDKDISPPKVLKYLPDSAPVNFHQNIFNVLFDEYIQLRDLNSQLVVSPPMKKAPDVKVKNKMLMVEIKDSLRKNTTYTFNFGTAIHDINEDNALPNFRFVFSTGSFIDSVSFSGTVKNAFNAKAEKGVLVMLYDDFSDSVPLKKLPNYFAKSKEDGSFHINNIKAGKYKLFALKESNNNYLYDVQAEESIAFSDTLIDLTKNNRAELSLFTEVPNKLFVKKYWQEEYGHLIMVFNKPVEEININPINVQYKKDWYLKEYNDNRDTLHLWLIDNGDPDSLIFSIDNNGKIIDTLEFKLIKKEEAMNPKDPKKKLKLVVTTNAIKGKLFDYNNNLELKFSHPMDSMSIRKDISLSENGTNEVAVFYGVGNFEGKNSEKKYYRKGALISKTRTDTIYVEEVETGHQEIVLVPAVHTFKENMIDSLIIPKGHFTDIFGAMNDSIVINFKTQEEKYYGALQLKLKISNQKNYILQLQNSTGQVVQGDFIIKTNSGEKPYPDDSFTLNSILEGNGKVKYNHVAPGIYKVKLIESQNYNHKWDTGNYLQHQQPEKVLYYPEEITVRSNWDMELEWTPLSNSPRRGEGK